MVITDALQTYTILSIGDGLVSQIPSIIVSIAAGILVTRSSEEANLGEFVGKQLLIYPKAVAISGVLLLAFSFFLSETFWPFFILSVACFVVAYLLHKKSIQEPSLSEIPSTQALEGGNTNNVGSQQGQQDGPIGGDSDKALSPVETAIEQEVFALEMDMVYWSWQTRKKGVIF